MKYRDGYGKLRVGHGKKGQNPFPPMVSPSAGPEAPMCLDRQAMQPSSSPPPLQTHKPHHYTNNQHKILRWETPPKPRDKESGFNSHSIWLSAFQKTMQKEKHHELHGLFIFSLEQALLGSKFIFLASQIKKLGYRGHGSFAQADRAKLNLNVCPSQLSFPEFLGRFAHWLFPPPLKHSSSPNLDRSKAHSAQGRLWQQQDSNLWVTGSLS